MSTNIFESGTTLRIECFITDESGDNYDPTGLTFTIQIPGGTPSEITYVSPETAGVGHIHKSAVGNYYIDWTTTSPGQYLFLWNASGDLNVAQRGAFTVVSLFGNC